MTPTRRSFARIAILWLAAVSVHAQETIPREPRPEERVTFDRSLPFKTAIDILSQYSMRFEGKLIIDPVGKTGPIGVLVNNMYWKQALEYILRSNLLKYQEHERYYEIVPLVQTQESQEAGPGLTPQTREIEINAIFFEADYNTLIEAGIDWSLVRNGQVRVNGRFASQVSRDLFDVQVNERYQTWDIFALLRVFESMDRGEVIANPKIKVLNGEEGKIQVGTNFFLTTRDFAGNTRFTEYESGVILRVTPQVIVRSDTTFIHLSIKAERSDVFPDPVQVTKSITESQTQVLLLDGEEAVIAGLFSHQTKNVRRGIPILKDLPPWFFGLRYLFGFESKEVKKKELIIILQAQLVPTIAERLSSTRPTRNNHLERLRQEFRQRLLDLKKKRSTNGRVYRRRK